MTRKIILVFACSILLAGCMASQYTDPVMQQKDTYVQARKSFNDSLIQLNTMLSLQPVDQKATLKAEFKPYIDAVISALDSWGVVVKSGDLNDTVQRRQYQEAKARMLALLTKYLTQ